MARYLLDVTERAQFFFGLLGRSIAFRHLQSFALVEAPGLRHQFVYDVGALRCKVP